MATKRDRSSRLDNLEVVEGVLPTAPDSLSEPVAKRQFRESLESGSLPEIQEQYAVQSREMSTSFDLVPDLSLIETSSLRTQLTGFANAGIVFFRADDDLISKSLIQRNETGANGTVTRVMQSNGRVLLETPRLVLKFAEQFDSEKVPEFLEERGLILIKPLLFMENGFIIASPQKYATDLSRQLMELAEVDVAEPDFVEHLGERSWPSDPEMSRSWHLENTGSVGADISARAAWNTTQGEDIHVAVIDNGFDTGHDDLDFGQISGWFRPTPDFDDADFQLGTGNMPAGNHGTACAGMIGAKANNGTGACGVAWASETSMISCLGDQIGAQSTLARAVAFAADPTMEPAAGVTGSKRADIISCSLGPNDAVWGMATVLEDAIDYASNSGREGRGTPIFWACTNGNYPISADQVCSYDPVIAVGRSTDQDLDDGSGYGPELDFLAPGVDVFLPGNGKNMPVTGLEYHLTTGTSFAAPCAAAVGALALSANPNLNTAGLRSVLQESCDKVGNIPYTDGRNDRFGFGRINAASAISEALAR